MYVLFELKINSTVVTEFMESFTSLTTLECTNIGWNTTNRECSYFQESKSFKNLKKLIIHYVESLNNSPTESSNMFCLWVNSLRAITTLEEFTFPYFDGPVDKNAVLNQRNLVTDLVIDAQKNKKTYKFGLEWIFFQLLFTPCQVPMIISKLFLQFQCCLSQHLNYLEGQA